MAAGKQQSSSGSIRKSTEPIPESELTPRVREALTTLMDDVSDLRGELERAKSRLREMETLADHDVLMANVLNRRAFVRELARAISFAERYDIETSLLYFDLNNFKPINDRYGHSVGDMLLRSIGKILITGIRDTDFVGRLGGDEFAVVLAKADLDGALIKAARLAAQIETVRVDTGIGLSVRVTTSYGAYTFQKGVDVEEALRLADEAMYKAKAESKSEDEEAARLAAEAENESIAPQEDKASEPEPVPEPEPEPEPAKVYFEKPPKQ